AIDLYPLPCDGWTYECRRAFECEQKPYPQKLDGLPVLSKSCSERLQKKTLLMHRFQKSLRFPLGCFGLSHKKQEFPPALVKLLRPKCRCPCHRLLRTHRFSHHWRKSL